jgi:hypothetical protein
MDEDPLAQLIVRPEQVEGEKRALLVKLVLPFAGIDPENNQIHFKATFDELNARQKVLVYLLARLALSALPNSKTLAAVSPKELEAQIKLPGGTIRPKLTQLAKEKIIIQSGGGYSASSSTLHRAQKELEAVISGLSEN